MDDVPTARMGSSMVYFNDKLWVYAGADPYGSGKVFSDFYSFLDELIICVYSNWRNMSSVLGKRKLKNLKYHSQGS